jgi:hypothetical protein
MFDFPKRNPPFATTAGFQITNIAVDAFIAAIIARGVLPGQQPYEPVGAAAAKAGGRPVMGRKAGAA